MAISLTEDTRGTGAKLLDIAGALGAGLQGRGQEFTQNLDIDRKRALAEDLRRMKLLFDKGDIAGIRNFAQNRIELIQSIDGTPTETQQLLDLTNQALTQDEASINRLGLELNEGLQEAELAGLIKLPKAPIPLSPEAKLEADRRAGLLPEGFKAEEDDTFTTLTKDETAALGFRPGQVIQKSSKTGKFFVIQSDGSKGQSFTISPDGTIVFEQGGSGELTRRTKGNIQQDLINNRQQLSQLDAAVRNFNPEFLKIEPRFNALLTSVSEKVGFEPSKEDKDFLGKFTTFKSDSLAQMNTQLKIRSGTAVTASEFTRLKGELPVVGTGIFDGDSPTEYMAKTKAIIRSLRMADARLNFALQKGIDFSSIPLDSINAIIDARGNELLSSGLSDEEVEKILKEEFGL